MWFGAVAAGLAKPRIIGATTTPVTPTSEMESFEKFEGYCTDVWFREGMLVTKVTPSAARS